MKKALKTFSDQQRLRSLPSGPLTPGNLFEELAGHFCDIQETKNYILARFCLVGALIQIKTYAAANAAYGHSLAIVRLNRHDHAGVCFLIPALALRLGKNQDCYDFCLWSSLPAQDEAFKSRDLDLPDPNVKRADVLELHKDLLNVCQPKRVHGLSHTVAITLLKIRFYLDISDLSKSFVLADKVPLEVINAIQDQILSGTSTTIACPKNIKNRDTQASILRELQSQIKALYKEVNTFNRRFWPFLLKPEVIPFEEPGPGGVYFVHGSIEESQFVFLHSQDAWAEVPGAIDVIRKLSEI